MPLLSSISTLRLTKNQWIGIGASILVLIFLFIAMPKPQTITREKVPTQPNPAAGGAPRLSPPETVQAPAHPSNFYGVLKDTHGALIQVALLEQQPNSAPVEGRTFDIETNEQTEYFFQKEIIGDGSAYFVPERAERKNLKKGLYLFVESPQGSSEIARITFSDKSPF